MVVVWDVLCICVASTGTAFDQLRRPPQSRARGQLVSRSRTNLKDLDAKGKRERRPKSLNQAAHGPKERARWLLLSPDMADPSAEGFDREKSRPVKAAIR